MGNDQDKNNIPKTEVPQTAQPVTTETPTPAQPVTAVQPTATLPEPPKVPNPDGKGGFADHPENINRDGRPPGELSVTYWIKKYLEGIEPKHKKQRVQELAEKIVIEAFKGNTKLMREVIDRIDGKPTQPIKHGGEVDVGLSELAQLIQNVIKQGNDDKPKTA